MAQLTRDSAPAVIGAKVIPTMRRIRTMENGLHVNDLKYRVLAAKPAPLITVRAYVLALSGPAGVGKTTITRSLLSLFSGVTEQVPAYTTRKARKGEAELTVYVSEKEFEEMVEKKEIIAHSVLRERDNCRVGYRKKDIDAVWKRHKLPLVTADVHLLEGLAKSIGRESILSCGLLPPGNSHRRRLSALLHRLRSYGHSEAQIEERLKTADADLKAFDAYGHLFDHILVNDQLETCVESIRELVSVGEIR
jgi:guanylate kinase